MATYLNSEINEIRPLCSLGYRIVPQISLLKHINLEHNEIQRHSVEKNGRDSVFLCQQNTD